jgi:hypothetical protein
MIPSDQLLTFGKSVTDVFKTFDPTKDPYVLALFVAGAKDAYTEYVTAYERDEKDPYTVLINASDKIRDRGFFGYRFYLESCTFSENAEEAAAANRLLDIVIKHGWGAAYMGFKKETSALIKMITETKDFNMADVTLINATSRYNLLVTRQADFEKVYNDSITRNPSSLPLLTHARPKLENALRTLLNIVDCHYSQNQNDVVLTGYVNAINQIITHTMAVARATQTREENEKKEEPKP